jgi:hypothetical protein
VSDKPARFTMRNAKCSVRINGKRCKGRVLIKPAHGIAVCQTCGEQYWAANVR